MHFSKTQAREFHENLPERIRGYLRRERGISDATVDHHLLGWNGERITIPVFDREGQLSFFKLAKDPEENSNSPKMLATPGARAELYGWERVLMTPPQIIICEGEFDRLVLENRGFAAGTSTGGASTFRPEWAEAFRGIPEVYICFDNDTSGQEGAKRVARMIPQARIIRLPDEIGEGGDVSDFFVHLGRSREEFLQLLAQAQPLSEAERVVPVTLARFPHRFERDGEVDRLKALVRIEDVISRYIHLRPRSRTLTGNCPFHEDRTPSFVVFSQTQSFYCFGCRERGDVLSFLMRAEHLTFPEALNALRELSGQNGGQRSRKN